MAANLRGETTVIRGALALACILCACTAEVQDPANSPDPLVALEASTQTTMYTGAFWGNEAKKDSPLWKTALEKCSTEYALRLPNCSFVRAEQHWRDSMKSVPTSTRYEPKVDLLERRLGKKPASEEGKQ
jgi:hypothetical protein